VECDTRRPVAAVEESLSAVAAGDVYGAARGYYNGARFLEAVLDGEGTVVSVSSMDRRDPRICRGGERALIELGGNLRTLVMHPLHYLKRR
jgi:hypothetical protein